MLPALLLLIAACGPQAAAPTNTPSPSPTASSSAGVTVVFTGVPAVAGDGSVEWCPGPYDEECPGIPVTGLSPDAIPAADEEIVRVWQVEGGSTGNAWRPAVHRSSRTGSPRTTSRRRVQVCGDETLARATWTSAPRDDVADHRAALEAAVGDRETVCVVGGARYSLAELERAQRRAPDIARDAGLGL